MKNAAPTKTIHLAHRLADLLQSNSIGNTTVIAIADALAADARYNMWFYDHVKPLEESAVMAKLDEAERLHDACVAAIEKFDAASTEKFDKDRSRQNLKELQAALETFAADVTKAMEIAP